MMLILYFDNAPSGTVMTWSSRVTEKWTHGLDISNVSAKK